MLNKEICLQCYQQHFSWGKENVTAYFERNWNSKILYCMTREGMFGIRQGHFEEDMANIEKAFAALPASDCPYILEHTVNAQ